MRKTHDLNGVVAVVLLLLGAALASNVHAVGKDPKVGKERISGKTGIDPEAPPEEMTMTLEQLLSDPEGVAEGATESRCINSRIATSTIILDSEHLLFRSGVGNRNWLNRLSRGCLGMRRDMVVVLEGRDANLCQRDTVYAIPRSSGSGFQTGRCSLGKFEPITAQHADMLKESFRIRGREMAEARRQERRDARAKRKAEKRAKREARKAAEAADQTG